MYHIGDDVEKLLINGEDGQGRVSYQLEGSYGEKREGEADVWIEERKELGSVSICGRRKEEKGTVTVNHDVKRSIAEINRYQT